MPPALKKLNRKWLKIIMKRDKNKEMIVIDSLPGSGKTSYAIEYINSHPELAVIYITPFLKEVDRIIKSCPGANFKQPAYVLEYEDGDKKMLRPCRKIDSFNDLLMNGNNIVASHSTFLNATSETMDYIKNGDYILIIDEALDAIVPFNDVCSDIDQMIRSADDIRMLREHHITVDEYGRVTWVGGHYNGKFSDVERIARSGNLLCIDNTLFVWEFPATIFSLFKKSIVLTYLFRGSILASYFQYHGIAWETKSVAKDDSGKYYLVDYYKDINTIKRLKGLIEICDNPKMNNYKNYALSKNWYTRNKKTELKQLKNNLNNYLRAICKAKAKDILWTCPKKYYPDLKGLGYISRKPLEEDKVLLINMIIERKGYKELSQEEKDGLVSNLGAKDLKSLIAELTKTEKETYEKRLNCFLPSNARATNDYIDRSVLAFLCNTYINPYIEKYFDRKIMLDGTDIDVDQDLYALSNMIQWIFRSRVRNGQPISIYIPSTRMRQLLKDWLDLKI